jgi:selenocysteine lyase/cysteine desulfurase
MPSKVAPPALEAALAERGFITGANDFYARRLVMALGLDPDVGVLRISMNHYTSGPEVSRMIGALEELL